MSHIVVYPAKTCVLVLEQNTNPSPTSKNSLPSSSSRARSAMVTAAMRARRASRSASSMRLRVAAVAFRQKLHGGRQ